MKDGKFLTYPKKISNNGDSMKKLIRLKGGFRQLN